MNDLLYTQTSNFFVSLDSRNATTYNNGSFNSNVEFILESPIRRPKDSIMFSTSVLAFTSPNSIYVINEYNNTFNYSIGSTSYSVNITKGNYNVNTFMTQFLSQMPTNFSITYNSITNQFTITYTSAWSITTGSTIYEIMGFAINTVYISNMGSITLPFTCNFNGVSHINIWIETFNTNNIESFDKSTGSIIQPIIIQSGSNQIIFQKSTIFEIPVNIDVIDSIQVEIKDDLLNHINFNNCNWNLTLHFSITEDVDRFKNDANFHNILKYA